MRVRQPMTFEDTTEIEQLRERVRDLIRDELPPSFKSAFVPGPKGQEIASTFCRRLAEERLLTAAWPLEYGGGSASVWEQTALREEFWAHDEPRGAQYMGVNWVGPAIMEFGTAAQRDVHLPPIAAGEAVWCQGFSEPEAGTDLASLALRATAQPDGTYLANGQKIWTSYATLASWCFLAARTNPEERRQRGISIFLVPMDRPGITVRTIDSIMGAHHLNEVFFDDVVLEESDRLGPLNGGWDVIEVVLRFERVGIARYARSERVLQQLWPYVQDAGGVTGEALRVAHALELAKARVARLLNYRVVASADGPGKTPVQPSIARIASTLLDQSVAELAMEVLGPDAIDNSPDLPLMGRAEDISRYARASTIASGTTEVQRLLAARHIIAES